MMITLIATLLLNSSSASAEEIKTEAPVAQNVEMDKNANDVVPSYTNIDGKDKIKEFSWGTVIYSSTTSSDDHDHSGEAQVHLNIRYTCKNGSKKVLPPQRFEFCGYAKSEIDLKQRAHTISELKKLIEHKNKTDAQLNAIYDAEYNDRIVDPAWNIVDKKDGDKVTLEILVRQKEARFGACEEKTTNLPLVIDCK